MGALEGKVVAVSGAARGQGRAHAMRFAEEGADVIAFDICEQVGTVQYKVATREDLEFTVKAVERLGRKIVASVTDVRDTSAVASAVDEGVDRLGRIDFVVANAGVSSIHPAQELDRESWQTVIDTNLTGPWNLCRAAMPHLIDQGEGGSFVLTGSSGAYIGLPNLSHYCSAKAGLVGLMQCLAVELGPHMIRVNVIHPTAVRTPMALNQTMYDLFLPGAGLSPGMPEGDEQVEAAFATLNSLPIPWVEPEDIAAAAIYLCSDSGRYVTGTELRVDAASGVR